MNPHPVAEVKEQSECLTHDGLQAAQDGSINEHLPDLHVDRQTGQVLSQRSEDVIVGMTRSNLSQEINGVTDRLRLRRIQCPTQEVLWGPVLTFLHEGKRVDQGD